MDDFSHAGEVPKSPLHRDVFELPTKFKIPGSVAGSAIDELVSISMEGIMEIASGSIDESMSQERDEKRIQNTSQLPVEALASLPYLQSPSKIAPVVVPEILMLSWTLIADGAVLPSPPLRPAL